MSRKLLLLFYLVPCITLGMDTQQEQPWVAPTTVRIHISQGVEVYVSLDCYKLITIRDLKRHLQNIVNIPIEKQILSPWVGHWYFLWQSLPFGNIANNIDDDANIQDIMEQYKTNEFSLLRRR